MPDLGPKLKSLRTERGMTQEALAGELFVTRQTVSNWENGKSRPDYEQLVKLAELFGVEPGIFLEEKARPAWSAEERRRVLALGVVTALFLLAELTLRPYLLELRRTTYNPLLWLFYLFFVRTVGVSVVTVFVLCLLSRRVSLPAAGRGTRRIFLAAAVVMVLIPAVIIFLYWFVPRLPVPLGWWNFFLGRAQDNVYFILVGLLLFFGAHRPAGRSRSQTP